MGRLKESIPEDIWDATEEEQNKYFYKENIKSIIEQNNPNKNHELREFLERVTPVTGPDYFIYTECKSTGAIANIKFNRSDYIDALCILADEKVTLFYHLASTRDWIKDENATAIRSICIDIDDVGISADDADYDTAINFLRNELKLEENQFCDYVNFSGHGIHAIWLIDEIPAEDEHIRKRYLESLLVKMSADCSCSPISHQFRVPCSYNLKDRVIKSKLFKITDCSNTDIHRLDWCLLPTEITEEYRTNYYARVHEKGLQTAQKNKEAVKELDKQLGDTPVEKYLSRTDLTDKERDIGERLQRARIREKKAAHLQEMLDSNKTKDLIGTLTQEDLDLYIYSDKALPFEHLEIYTNFNSSNRTWNLIYDLQNYFIRNKGFLPSRNMFFTILAHAFKYKKLSERSAIKFCLRFIDEEYKKEMVGIIEQVYYSKTTYIPHYEKIAKLLCFSEEDIEKSFCNFSKERKESARKERNHRYYESTRNAAGKLSPKEREKLNLEYLRTHPDISTKEGMAALGVGRTTYSALKKKLETMMAEESSDCSKN